MHRPSSARLVATCALLAALVLPAIGSASPAAPAAQEGGGTFVTSNGFVMQAGQTLPIFTFATPTVNPQTTRPLARLLDGVVSPNDPLPSVGQENYLNKPRYTVPNTQTTSLLTQYGATGGFYAYNSSNLSRDPNEAAKDPSLNGPSRIPPTTTAIGWACQFLRSNNLVADSGLTLVNGQQPQGPQGLQVSVPGFTNTCVPQIGAVPSDVTLQQTAGISATLIRATGQQNTPGAAQDPVVNVGAVVRVPLRVQVGFEPNATAVFPRYVALGGPGGHISLLMNSLSTNSTLPTLDSSTPGLGAVSLPFYGRQFTKLRDVPTRDPAAVQQQVQQEVQRAFPGAQIQIPTPAIFYMVSDAAQEQKALEPMLSFSGIQVTVNGNTIFLKDLLLPAVPPGAGVTGFGPDVSITSPNNNDLYSPGATVTINGNIANGKAPFSYQWLLDDGTELSQPATINTTGLVSLQTDKLPAFDKNSLPAPNTVILRVTDDEGAIRQAQVTLRPTVVPLMYLPLINNGSTGTQSIPMAAPQATDDDVSLAAVNYRFGVEAAADYPPYGPGGADLPGVVPDATGFRSGMQGYGWSQRFYWSDQNVWEKDWRDCSLGGGDCTYGVDRADFVYFAGHGGPGGISPSRKDRDNDWASAENARFQNVRWVGFASCQTLRVQGSTPPNEPIRRWFNSFQGSSMLLGFNSNMADLAFGPRLVDNMRIPSFFGGLIEFPWAQISIRDAWVKTAFDMNAGKPAYIYATSASYNPANEKLPKGSDPLKPRPLPVNWYYWVWWNE